MKYIVKYKDFRGMNHSTGLLSRTEMLLATDRYLNNEDIDLDLVVIIDVSTADQVLQ